jgi:protein-S-isoprenylcysteine O-methyltransferase Ste14
LSVADLVHGIVTGPAGRRVAITWIAFVSFVAAIAGAVLGSLWLDRRLGTGLQILPSVALTAGLLVLGLGVLLMAWCVVVFCLARGTPVPFSPPRALVVRGPYRYARNPMLTGFLVALAGAGLTTRSPVLLFGVLPAAIAIAWLGVRYVEEPGLVLRFGSQYLEYRENVPMFVPKTLRRWGASSN